MAEKPELTETMIKDDVHILAFDIIYCAVTYGLYSGMKLMKPVKKMSAKDRMDAKILELQAELKENTDILDKEIKSMKGRISTVEMQIGGLYIDR